VDLSDAADGALVVWPQTARQCGTHGRMWEQHLPAECCKLQPTAPRGGRGLARVTGSPRAIAMRRALYHQHSSRMYVSVIA